MKSTIVKSFAALFFLCVTLCVNANAQVKVGDTKDGGIVYFVDEQGAHGLIADKADMGRMTWAAAEKACAEKGQGWRLPTRDEMVKLYANMGKVGRFEQNDYWTSTESVRPLPHHPKMHGSVCIYFQNGSAHALPKTAASFVRAVRAF